MSNEKNTSEVIADSVLSAIVRKASAAVARDVQGRAFRLAIGQVVAESGHTAVAIAEALAARDDVHGLGLSAGSLSQWTNLYQVFVADGGYDVADVAERGSLDKTYRWAVAGKSPAMTPDAIMGLSAVEYDALPARPPRETKATGRTSIPVDKETKDALDELRNENETYDELLARLMKRVTTPRARPSRETLPTVQA